MAGDEDGAYFRGIDQEFWGDGTTDSDTRFLSAGQENALDHNERFLHGLGNCGTVNWRTVYDPSNDNLDGRRFVTNDRQWGVWLFWPPLPTLTRVRFRFEYQIAWGVSSNTTPEMNLYGQVRDLQTGQTWNTETKQSQSAGISFLEMDVDVDPGSMSNMGLDIQFGWNSVGFEIVRDGATFPAVSNWSVDPADGGTQGAVADDVGRTTFLRKQGVGELDVLHKSSADSNGVEEVGVPDNVGAWQGNSGAEWDILGLPFITPKSLTIEAITAKGQDSAQFVPGAPSTMEPQTPVKGRHASRHGQNLDETWERPKIRAIGPYGLEENGLGWSRGNCTAWKWMLAARTGVDFNNYLDRQQLKLESENPSVAVYGYLLCFIGARSQDDWPTPKDKDKYLDWATRADLEMELSVYQYDSSANSDQKKASKRVLPKTDFFPIAPTGGFHLPNVLTWTFRNLENDNTPPYFESPKAVREAFDEGQIKPGDRGLLTPFRVAIDLSDVSSSAWDTEPLHAELAVTDYLNESPNPTLPDPSNHGIIATVSTTWFELPKAQ